MDLGDPNRAGRLDALAAEYALGTLPPRTRRRLQAAGRADPRVAAVVQDWEHRLASLAGAMPPVTPPPRVWAGVRARLGMVEPANERPAAAGWWASLGLWRGLAMAGFALAAVLGVLLATVPTGPGGEAVVVVLAAPDARPALVASAPRNGRTLLVKAVGVAPVAPGRSLELWALPQGRDPQSLGVVPADGIARVSLPAPADEALRNVPALAVTLEPAGGSPSGKPTGPILYSGPVQRFY